MAFHELVDSVESFEKALKKVKEAQEIFSTYTQEQVDAIFFAAASAANKQRIPLAKMAVEETGYGIVEDKVIKNNYAAEHIYNAYKQRPAALSSATRHTALRRSQSLSALSARLFLQPTLLPPLSSRPLSLSRPETVSSSAHTPVQRSAPLRLQRSFMRQQLRLALLTASSLG